MDELPARIRAFVALRLAPEVENAIETFVETLREFDAGIGWVARDRLHVTLRYLGDAVDSTLVAPIGKVLAQIASETAPFTIDARGTGAFPNFNRPRVVWIGLQAENLKPLARHVDEGVVRCSLAADDRPYSPHLTIGRVRNSHGWGNVRRTLADAVDREFGSSRIDSMILYRSVLGGGSARYQELGRYMLRA